jgi:hypothetical protein
MRPWIRWLYVIAGVAAAFVAVSSIVQAVRQGSWTPVVSVAWLPAGSSRSGPAPTAAACAGDAARPGEPAPRK